MPSIIARLRRFAGAPDRLFCRIVHGDEATEISYGRLFENARAYARRFADDGLSAGDIVVIVAPHGADMLYAFVGALSGGFTPAFLSPLTDRQDPELYWASLARLLERTRAGALVAARADIDAIRRVAPDGLPLIAPDDVAPPPAAAAFQWPDPAPDDVAFIQFSSGTTGLRKGVPLTHRAVLEQVAAFQQATPFADGDVVASWLPLYHDMGLIACFIIPLIVGAPVVYMSPLEWVRRPTMLLSWMERLRATHAWLPNFAFKHLALMTPTDAAFDLSHVKALVNCSESCKPETFDAFLKRFARMGVRADQLQTCYAMAEAVFAVSASRPGQAVRRLTVDPHGTGPRSMLSVGRPLPGFAVRVVDDAFRDVPDGAEGEIALSGPCVFPGYHNAPDADADAFRDGWFLTGDLGFLDDGEVFVSGRRKDVIVVNGRNYYAHDIEAAANEADGVKPGRLVAVAAVCAATDSEEALVLAEVDEDADPARRKAISAAIKTQAMRRLGLAVRVELTPPQWLIKTSSGKLARGENLKRHQELKATQRAVVAEKGRNKT